MWVLTSMWVFEIMAMWRKLLKPSRKLKREAYISTDKKNFLNSIKNWEKKPKDLINKKSPKLNKKIRDTIDHLLFCVLYGYLVYKG